MQPHQLHPQLESDFNAVNDFILGNLHSDVPLVEKIGHYIVESGGKRVRPILVLLSARICGYQGQDHITLANRVPLAVGCGQVGIGRFF